MKKFIIAVLLIIFAFVQTVNAEQNTIKIASFNIQIFGQSKAGKDDVMLTLAKIITRYDIVAIQEIRDKAGTAIVKLESYVDNLGVDYSCYVGPRLGRTSSKEQYAYMYRTNTIDFVSAYTFDDAEHDWFHREPLIAQFKVDSGKFDFVLMTIHTDPDEATQEISKIPEVFTDAISHYANEKDFLILGDLNADCNYFDEDAENELKDIKYTWLITDDMDTNVASSSCAYDRLIMLDSSKEDYAGASGVFRFDEEFNLSVEQTKDVSDHYPVWAEFYTDKDTDETEKTVPAIISPDLSIYIPNLKYNTGTEDLYLWVNLVFAGERNGELLWKLLDYGLADQDGGVSASMSPELNINIPVLQYGSVNLQANFEFVGSSNNEILWKLSEYNNET